MTTICRILKFTPAAVLGLMVAVWLLTQGGWIHFCSGMCVIDFQHGSITGYWQESDGIRLFWTFRDEWWFRDGVDLGRMQVPGPLSATGYWFPIPLLCTFILPFAVGPFFSFRFRLWRYLAFTALIAVGLAYYLPNAP